MVGCIVRQVELLQSPSVALFGHTGKLLHKNGYNKRKELNKERASKFNGCGCTYKPSRANGGGLIRCQALPSTIPQKNTKGNDAKSQPETWKATVRILKEGIFDVAAHKLSEASGQRIKMYLLSVELDPETKQEKLSPEVDLKFEHTTESGTDQLITVEFKVPKGFGRPGALLIDSHHDNEFFLRSVTLEIPDSTTIQFYCNSWITESKLNNGRARVFFTNQPCLPDETPEALKSLRDEDLSLLRGDGKGERKSGERIYDYDVYNDLGNPDSDKKYTRPVLGGSTQYPYPRRCRTGRERTKADPSSEKPAAFNGAYLPRDEHFSPQKLAMFYAAGARCFGHDVLPVLKSIFDEDKQFNVFNEVHQLYDGELRSASQNMNWLRNPRDGTPIRFPPPGIVQANKESWRTDAEFGRQRLAGANPLCIQLLTDFPLVSALDPQVYGPAESAITEQDLKPYLEGLSVEQAIKDKILFILDFHDAIMPYVNKINEDGGGKIYASRTIFFLTRFGFLLPTVIELSLPPKKKGEKGSKRVFRKPPPDFVDWEWRLAKTHVACVDEGVHELISHWLRTHACVEPFIIATKRQLSAMHPLYTFLLPHFKDTMHINALARTALIKADGIIELCFIPGKYSMEISSMFYKDWRFDEQALPKDLLKRGMAEKDSTSKHGVKLVIKDYPYAEDGLEVWGAIKQWVKDYVGIYYKKNEDVARDVELQGWWKEVTEIGHGDHKGAEWWGQMKTIKELVDAMTTLVWITSGHHAAVNFGQYAYLGFFPNAPTTCKFFVPERGTPEHEDLLKDPENFFLRMVSSEGQAMLVMATVEILAQHMGDEEYLGQRKDAKWNSDPQALQAYERFQQALLSVEDHVESRNADPRSHANRVGPALLPYTLLAPYSQEGLTFRGIPNSISI